MAQPANPITLLSRADDVLRGQRWTMDASHPAKVILILLSLVLLFGITYGAAMGTFGGGRFLQIAYSALKVPMLLLVTFVVALPSFFVLNTLLGVRDDFPMAVRALLTTQAGLTIVLASLCPFTLLWYASSDFYQGAILFNTLMFAIASIAAQRLLQRCYRPLIDKNPVHRKLLRAWLTIYAFVGIQLGWVLRPFIGDPSQPTHFFRDEAWGNAYVVVAQMIWTVFLRLVGH
jgi:hypothetical protein